jgi:hypothetical protein
MNPTFSFINSSGDYVLTIRCKTEEQAWKKAEKQFGEISESFECEISTPSKKADDFNIFKALEELQIPYAVCVNIIRAKGVADMLIPDYFISCAIQDWPTIKGLKQTVEQATKRFHAVSEANALGLHTGVMIGRNNKKVAEWDMSEEDIYYFKDNQDKFVKVVHTADGRVFEQKSVSLKKHIENLNGGKK